MMVAADGEDPDEPVVQRLTLHEHAAEEFGNAAWNSIPDIDGDTVLVEYEPGYKRDRHELLYVDLDQAPEVAAMVELVAGVAQAEEFDESDEVIANLRFYGVVFGSPRGRRAVFFRSYSPKKELTRSRGFALIKRRGQYDRFEEKVFLFDDDMDCFAWNGRMFIWNVGQFQRIFRYFERLRESVDQTIDTVSARVPISNLNEFRDAVTGQIQMMAKLTAVARKGYLSSLTMDAVRRTINQCRLDVQIITEDGQEKLLFEPGPAKRWVILKLLDDDYLQSIMTDEIYEANSKKGLQG